MILGASVDNLRYLGIPGHSPQQNILSSLDTAACAGSGSVHFVTQPPLQLGERG
jgi:hypothetical protein